jgi:hypothetical protein
MLGGGARIISEATAERVKVVGRRFRTPCRAQAVEIGWPARLPYAQAVGTQGVDDGDQEDVEDRWQPRRRPLNASHRMARYETRTVMSGVRQALAMKMSSLCSGEVIADPPGIAAAPRRPRARDAGGAARKPAGVSPRRRRR